MAIYSPFKDRPLFQKKFSGSFKNPFQSFFGDNESQKL